VGRVDHLNTGGDGRSDERNVFWRFRQSVRSEPDPSHAEIAKPHGPDSDGSPLVAATGVSGLLSAD
ncbi:MAG TPA: hypothetical protein VF383_05410, partial [Candidatus Dormibacteraeota bacterium]